MGSTASLPEHLAAIFMEAQARDQDLPLDLITLLSQMGLGRDRLLAEQATNSLYRLIILPLCDDFTDHGTAVANKVIITMLQAFLRTSAGAAARQILATHKLSDPAAIIERHRQLQQGKPLSQAHSALIKKAFILSRVTLGADIAITSIIAQRLRQALPQAEIFLVGPDHLSRLFAGGSLRFIDFPFDRDGSLHEKFAAWPRLYNCLAEQTKNLARREIALFDPDSRLSQLGLLPLVPLSSTYYLTSRTDSAGEATLPEITNAWLDRIVPDSSRAMPSFCLQPSVQQKARLFFQYLPATTFTVLINFGVGNDANKRLGTTFEKELLEALLAIPDTLVILDSGKGGPEHEAAKRLMAKTAEKGYKTAELSETELADATIASGTALLRFSGNIDAVAALIDHSHLFIGYDSCCQHLATATRTPAIICFAGAANKRFLRRWQPGNHHGKTTTIVIDKQPCTSSQRTALINKIIKKAASCHPGQ